LRIRRRRNRWNELWEWRILRCEERKWEKRAGIEVISSSEDLLISKWHSIYAKDIVRYHFYYNYVL